MASNTPSTAQIKYFANLFNENAKELYGAITTTISEEDTKVTLAHLLQASLAIIKSFDKDLEHLPSNLILDYSNNIDDCLNIIYNLNEKYHKSNLSEGELSESLDKIYNKLVNINRSRASYNRLINADDETDYLKKELESIRLKSEQDAEEINKLKNSFTHEINTLNTQYKEDLSKFENISQALTFQEASKSYQKKATAWQRSLIVLSLLLIVLICIFAEKTWIDFNVITQNKGAAFISTTERINTLFYYEIISKAALRVIVLSLIVFLIKFAAKNYNANKHNTIINLHKANSLATASRLIATTPDNETFNTIISLAAKEIFSQPRTGFLNKENTKTDISLLNDLASSYMPKTKSSE